MSWQQPIFQIKNCSNRLSAHLSESQRNKDPLGVFPAVDQNSDHAVSESEYLVLQKGIKTITGKEITGEISVDREQLSSYSESKNNEENHEDELK